MKTIYWTNKSTDYTTFNLTPELLLGWRAVMNIASVAWSNIPQSKTSMGLLPFPYNINFNPGIAWQF